MSDNKHKTGVEPGHNSPLVSVVMAAYNAEKYIRECLDSILGQTLEDFEFIIIDDGSTDGTGAILDDYSGLDKRIKAVHQENTRLIPALNRGCKMARGKYIARMDADDVSLSQRFEKQATFLETHPDIGIVDTWVEREDGMGNKIGEWRTPLTPILIEWTMFFENPLRQSSVMARRKVLEALGFYSTEAEVLEDYYLWAKAVDITRIGCIPEFLTRVRFYGDSRSRREVDKKKRFANEIVRSLVKKLPGSLSDDEAVDYLYHEHHSDFSRDVKKIIMTAGLMLNLCAAFIKAKSLSGEAAHSVKDDAGNRIMALARLAWEISPVRALRVMAMAHRLQPGWILSRTIPNGAQRIIRNITRE